MDRLQEQHRDRRDLDEGQEVACRLFVARRNTAKLFDAVDESCPVAWALIRQFTAPQFTQALLDSLNLQLTPPLQRRRSCPVC